MIEFLFITCYFVFGFIVIRKIFPTFWYEAVCLAPLPVIFPIIVIGTPIYFFYKLDSLVIFLLLCSPLLVWIPFFWKEIKNYQLNINNFKIKIPEFSLHITSYGLQVTLLFFSYLIILAFLFFLLLKFQTTNSVLGPWVLIREPFLFLYAVAILLLCALCIQIQNRALTFVCIVLAYILSFSVTYILFPLGFGYDPFLHQATERHILEFGMITPKTFYYLGHYICVIIFSKISSLPLSLLDISFLPIFASLVIPAAISYFLRTYTTSSLPIQSLALVSLLIMPFSYATLTTPWGFAVVLTILLSIFSICHISLKSNISITFLGLLTLSILFIHPLAGILACGVFFILILTSYQSLFFKHKPYLKKIIIPLFLFIFSFAEALAFIINSKISGQLVISLKTPTFENIHFLLSPIIPTWVTSFHFFYDTAYLFKKNLTLMIALGIGVSILFLIKNKKSLYGNSAFGWYGFFVCALSVIPLTLFLDFPSLVWYERLNYVTRFFELAPLFLIPFILIFFTLCWNAIFYTHNRLVILFVLLFFSGFITTSLYLSYPHVDPYTNYHGYNLSQTDIKTVQWISSDMKDRHCIVLANQMVGVAAIREFGFTGYRDYTIQGKRQHLFYYPIPTGSPLYPYFLKMIGTPSREIIQRAMDEFHVSCAYFVINSYENRFSRIVQAAKLTTNKWVAIDNDKNFIYSYHR